MVHINCIYYIAFFLIVHVYTHIFIHIVDTFDQQLTVRLDYTLKLSTQAHWKNIYAARLCSLHISQQLQIEKIVYFISIIV